MIVLLVVVVVLALGLLVMLAGVCAFHLAVGDGRFQDLDCSCWEGLFGRYPCDGK
jgi:hypothetical protein